MDDAPVSQPVRARERRAESSALARARGALDRSQLGLAERLCRRWLARRGPESAGIWGGIDCLARVLVARGRSAEALELVDHELRASPDRVALHATRGVVLRDRGLAEEAEASFRLTIQLDPAFAPAHAELGALLCSAGAVAEGIASLRRAVALSPRDARLRLQLACALERTGDLDAAHGQFVVAAHLDPEIGEAHHGLGRVFLARGRVPAAMECLRSAIALNPRSAVAHCNLGLALERAGDSVAAERQFHRALRLRPDLLLAHTRLGLLCLARQHPHGALASLRRAARLGLGAFDAQLQVAGALHGLGRVRAAERAYRQALALQPGNRTARSGLLFLLSANVVLSRPRMLGELRQWDRHCGAPPGMVRREHHRDRSRNRRLRIGYVSPDFRNHVVRQFFEAVLAYHDRSAFDLYCYAQVVEKSFAVRRFRELSDHWLSTVGMDDAGLARRVNDDGIDILIDLAGHTAGNRLGVFAFRPAPVQATYLGYFASTGLSSIDYWITDRVLHPPDTREPALERIYRLPRCAFGYGIPTDAPMVDVSPRDHGILFGCANNLVKVRPRTLDTWCRILDACPDSRLVLRDPQFEEAGTRKRWLRRFESRGIAAGRVSLLGRLTHDRYMHWLSEVDIALDTFPRTGGTTTADCLWMGVPVITLAGRRYVERLSAAKLSAIGMDDLITDTRDRYVQCAVALARDRPRLAQLRGTLRPTMLHSPLCDTRDLTRSLEAAYRDMWLRYLR